MTGRVSFPMWLVLRVETPLPAPSRGKGEWGARTTALLLLVSSILPHASRPFLLGKCLVYVPSEIPVACWKEEC